MDVNADVLLLKPGELEGSCHCVGLSVLVEIHPEKSMLEHGYSQGRATKYILGLQEGLHFIPSLSQPTLALVGSCVSGSKGLVEEALEVIERLVVENGRHCV